MDLPKKLREEIIFESNFKSFLQKDFLRKDNKVGNYFITTDWGTKSATIVLAITEDLEVIYNKEFRYWVEDVILNLPMWRLEENTWEKENVNKELREETWYYSDNIIYLWESIIANYDDTIWKYFLALDCRDGGLRDLETSEYIEVQKTSLVNFEQMIFDWKIKCPLSMSCFCLAKKYIDKLKL